MKLRYYLVPDTILSVKDGQKVSAGDVLARLPKETSKTKDITGGLPRVAELFEARRPKDSAIIAENDGVIQFGKEVRGKQKNFNRFFIRRNIKLSYSKRQTC